MKKNKEASESTQIGFFKTFQEIHTGKLRADWEEICDLPIVQNGEREIEEMSEEEKKLLTWLILHIESQTDSVSERIYDLVSNTMWLSIESRLPTLEEDTVGLRKGGKIIAFKSPEQELIEYVDFLFGDS